MTCIDCGCSLKPPRPLFCIGGNLHRDSNGVSFETPEDRAAADAAMAEYRSHPTGNVAVFFHLMRIDARARMRFFESGAKPEAPPLFGAIRRST
jgi:hypothetical protein